MTFTRKLLAMLLCVALVASLAMFAGCGEPKEDGGNDAVTTTTVTTPTTTAPPQLTDAELIVGTWKGTYDITEAINKMYADTDSESDIITFEGLAFEMIITYNADGTYNAAADEDSVAAFMQQFKKGFHDFFINMYETLAKDSGYASAEAMFAEMGSDFNSTINETVDSSVSQEMIDQMVASFVSKGTYEIEDGKLYSAPEGTELNKEQYETYEITADTLKLLSYVGDTTIKDDAGNDTGMSIDPTTLYPITFTKVK